MTARSCKEEYLIATGQALYVCHGMYGCDTGCCGYRLCRDDEGDEVVGEFTFHHPSKDDSVEVFAKEEWDDIDFHNIVILKGKWYDC